VLAELGAQLTAANDAASVDDPVAIAQAQRDKTAAVLAAQQALASIQATPAVAFAGVMPGGGGGGMFGGIWDGIVDWWNSSTIVAWTGGFFSGLWDGVVNIGTGAYMLVHDLVTMPIDLVMTTYGIFDTSSQWQQLSYFGAQTEHALQNGTSIWEIEGRTLLNVGTLGLYGLGATAYEWYETGDPTSFQQYTGSFATGVFAFGYARGVEISFGKNFRAAPFGNRTGHPTGRYPHYHRRGVDSTGQTKPGQGIGRHRPWDTKSTDTGFGDRF